MRGVATIWRLECACFLVLSSLLAACGGESAKASTAFQAAGGQPAKTIPNAPAGVGATMPPAAGSAAAATSLPAVAGTGSAPPSSVVMPVAGTGAPAAGAPAASVSNPGPTAGTMAAAGDGGSMAAPPAASGDFPKDEPVNVEQKGPHQFKSYTEGLDDPTYASSVMYYPTDATPPFASAVFSPGFSATKENYQTFLGELLASHGIAMLLTTPTTTGDLPQQRGEDLVAAVAHIAKENEREGSPLKGKLAVDRVCVTGHSMGGGGTLWAATTLGNKIRCAMPLQPWQPGQSFNMVVAPTMFIAAQSDTIAAVAQNAMVFYNSIPASVEKYYVEFSGASHFLTTNDLGTSYDGQSKYMLAFYKIHLEDDMRYRDVLTAAMDKELSMYLTSFKK
jgi:dienelactone hydrolase